MSATAQSRRRWFQFSLRTFFVLVTFVCVSVGYWVHWSKEWIRERHEAISSERVRCLPADPFRETPIAVSAPGFLWVFGEHGVHTIFYKRGEEELAKRLFPESHVIFNFNDDHL
jgi:hypothetical protein